MKQYITSEQADYILENEVVLEYPSVDTNVELFPVIEPAIPDPATGEDNKPRHLLLEVMDCIGEEPKKVLELGGGIGADALYLAAHGHDVTVFDTDDQSVGWQNYWAHELGLHSSMRAQVADVRTLPATPKYDVIMADMLLHFLDPVESRNAISRIQAATNLGGLNILGVYIDDNPDQEKMPPRYLNHFFAPGTLAGAYPANEWETIRDEEGLCDRSVDRGFIARGKVLIPSIAELVVRKVAEPAPIVLDFGFTVAGNSHTYVL